MAMAPWVGKVDVSRYSAFDPEAEIITTGSREEISRLETQAY